MQKDYRSEVRSDDEYADVPQVAVFQVNESLAKEIVRLANLVELNELYKVEKFDCRATYFKHDSETDPEDAIEAGEENEVITDTDTINVSENEFWYSTYLKHTNIEISTERQSIAELVEHFKIVPPSEVIMETKVSQVSDRDLLDSLFSYLTRNYADDQWDGSTKEMLQEIAAHLGEQPLVFEDEEEEANLV
jgi:hypothetical protein